MNTTQPQIVLSIVQLEHRSRMQTSCMCPNCAQQRLLSSQASSKNKCGLERVPGTASAPALQWPEHPLPCWDCCHPSFCGAGQCQCPGAHPSCPPHSPAPATHSWHVLYTGPIKSQVTAKWFQAHNQSVVKQGDSHCILSKLCAYNTNWDLLR